MGTICSKGENQRTTELASNILRTKLHIAELTVKLNTQSETISTLICSHKTHIESMLALVDVLNKMSEVDIEDSTGDCVYKHNTGCYMIDVLYALQKGVAEELSTITKLENGIGTNHLQTAISNTRIRRQSMRNLRRVHSLSSSIAESDTCMCSN